MATLLSAKPSQLALYLLSLSFHQLLTCSNRSSSRWDATYAPRPCLPAKKLSTLHLSQKLLKQVGLTKNSSPAAHHLDCYFNTSRIIKLHHHCGLPAQHLLFLSLMMLQLWQNFLGKLFWWFSAKILLSAKIPNQPTSLAISSVAALPLCCRLHAPPLLNICKFSPGPGISTSNPWHQQKSKYLHMMQISRLRTGRFWWRLRRRAGATFAPVSVATAVARAVARPS